MMIAPIDPFGSDVRRTVLDEAHTALRLHVAGEQGFCSGCLDLVRLATVPCARQRAVLRVVETHT